jgi:putative toxin-antitoxin system antitoxin component (TIGR02293 family)
MDRDRRHKSAPSRGGNIAQPERQGRLGSEQQQQIGKQLRALSDKVIRDGAADRFAELLRRLDETAAPRAIPEALAALKHHGYSDDEISALVVPKRTLARRIAGQELLTVEETDKALRLERIAVQAERVFGDPTKAQRWLRKPKERLGGETPVAFLASESGARVVEEMLHQIEHGMFA